MKQITSILKMTFIAMILTSMGINAQHNYDDQNVIYSENRNLGIRTSRPRGELQINTIHPILFNSNGGRWVDGSEIGFNAKLNTSVIPNKFIKLGGTLQRGGAIQVVDNRGNMCFQMYDSGSLDERIIDYKPNIIFNNKGYVGIGTTSPITTLDVNGSVKLGNGATYSDLVFKTGTAMSGTNGVFEIFPRTIPLTGTARQTTHFKNASDFFGKTEHDVLVDGNVGIGTSDTKGFKLGVNGKIFANEIKVAIYPNWPDFVFEKTYSLPSLREVENHIKEKGHLKNIPSSKEVEKNGFFLGEMDAKLLQKIEELTLYIIEQEKKFEKQEKEMEELKALVLEITKDRN